MAGGRGADAEGLQVRWQPASTESRAQGTQAARRAEPDGGALAVPPEEGGRAGRQARAGQRLSRTSSPPPPACCPSPACPPAGATSWRMHAMRRPSAATSTSSPATAPTPQCAAGWLPRKLCANGQHARRARGRRQEQGRAPNTAADEQRCALLLQRVAPDRCPGPARLPARSPAPAACDSEGHGGGRAGRLTWRQRHARNDSPNRAASACSPGSPA